MPAVLRRTDARIAASVLLVLVLAMTWTQDTLAVFTDSDANGSNTFTASTISLTLNPTSALITYSNMQPGDSVTNSIVVTNNGGSQLRYAISSSATNADAKALKDQLVLTIKTIDVTTPGTPCDNFDGSNDYVTRAYTAALNPAQFTVEAWVDATGGTNTWRTAVGSWTSGGGSTEKGWWLGISGDDNTWRWQIGTGSGVGQVYGPGPTLNSWTHAVGTYDGTTARFYVNGASVGSVTTTYSANALRPTVIGAYQPGAGSYQMFLPGLIDDVAVYNRVLSATEIQLHYDSGRQ
jgi:Concanavalin A-like lectin/glucanases superfamily/Camelysin metallo-endopeptidase